jgi:isopenicillin-N epimerase
LRFRRGDELLVTDHEYNACRNALAFVAAQSGAKLVVAPIPFPVRRPDDAFEPLAARTNRRTRLVLIDHVTSPTGLVLPLERWIPWLRSRDVDVLVDGAHAPGMIPLRLEKLGATYYTGNCHKWLGAPKGAGFLWVHPSRQNVVRPLAISHGANSPRKDRSRFLIEFGWTGTWDPSAWLTVPEAIRAMAARVPGGWPAIRRRNRRLALAMQKLICEALGMDAPCPPSMIGSMVAVPLPPSPNSKPPKSPLYSDPLQHELLQSARIEVPIIPWPAWPDRLLRTSSQLYNHLGEGRALVAALDRAGIVPKP